MWRKSFQNGNRKRIIFFIGYIILEMFIISLLVFHKWDSNDGVVKDFIIGLASAFVPAIMGKEGHSITSAVKRYASIAKSLKDDDEKTV